MTFPPPLQKTGKMLAILFLLFQQAQAQDFVIVHDLLKDTTSFYRIGKAKDTVRVPEIGFRKPGRISLEVDNFNPFYWNAKVTTRPVEESGSIGMFMNSMTSVLGISGFPSVSRGGNKETEKLKALYNQLEELGVQLKELKYNIQKPASEIKSEARKIGATVMALIGKDSLNAKEMRLTGKELDKSLGEEPETPFSELLSLIEKMHSEIVNTSYKYLYNRKNNADISEITLLIYPRSDSIARENPMDTIAKYFPLRDRASLKLRNSVGVTFTYFRDKNRSYYVKPDLTIGSGNADLFTPVISTFIHFYTNNNTGLKWGGSFGFGIPLTGEKKDINFMLGLCMAIGRTEPIIISAGLAGTKVDRLTEGWKTGDTVPGLDFDIPKLSQFRTGGFISISFNLKNLSPNKHED